MSTISQNVKNFSFALCKMNIQILQVRIVYTVNLRCLQRNDIIEYICEATGALLLRPFMKGV